MAFYVNDNNDELLEFDLRENAWEYAKENTPAMVFQAPSGYSSVAELMQYHHWSIALDGTITYIESERRWTQ